VKRRYREVLLAAISGAALALLSIQLHMIHAKRSEIAQIADQQRALMEQLSQFHQEINRYISR
jgi:hypothetical protein